MIPTTPLDGVKASLPLDPAGAAAAALLQALGAATTHGDDGRWSATTAAQPNVAVAALSPAALELDLAAACGALALTGEPGRPALWPNAPVCGGLLGLTVTYRLLASLLAKPNPEAPPQRIDPARWLTYLMGIARAYHETGVEPQRAGSRSPALTPASPYPDTLLPCVDGWVHAHYAPSDPALLPSLLSERQAAVGHTAADADTIDGALKRWLSTRTREQAAGEAEELRHPFVPVTTLAELRQAYSDGLPPPVRLTPPSQRAAEPVPASVAGPGGLPLAGVRVTELSVAVAGPMAGELLRLLGATVTRIAHPVAAAPGWYDRDKPTQVADLATQEGRRGVVATLSESDVFLTNLSARAQQNLGLVDLLQAAAQPGLVSVAFTAFPTGDARHLWGAFDSGMQAAAGLSDATRYPDGGPLRVGGHPIDAATALVAASTALAGLWQRRHTGRGLSAEVSMLGAGLLLMAPLLEGGAARKKAALNARVGEPPTTLASVTKFAIERHWLPF